MLTTLLAQLKNQPDTVQFKDVIDCIAATYLYTPSQFTNGEQVNEAGQNEGSCKIFAFAQLNNLDEQICKSQVEWAYGREEKSL